MARSSVKQEFQIIAIISGSQVMAELLTLRFEEIDRALTEATFADPLDEARVHKLSEQEATLISQLISLKVVAKAKIFRVLTADQRALVSRQVRTQQQTEGNLGAITIY